MADENSDPRRALAERLVADIPTDACILAYNKGFECTRLKELAETFPDLSEKLLAIRENVRDLLDVFRNGYVYDRAMGGSFSIKKVLPALFPNDPNLDYHSLMDVHNGTEATDTYLSLGRRATNCGRAFWRIADWTPSPWSCFGRDCGSFVIVEFFRAGGRDK